MRKAFYRVWHKGLLCKLSAVGISGILLTWVRVSNYLSGSRQRVIFPGTHSSRKFIHTGVPQGSVVGPLLLLLYINDKVKDIWSNITQQICIYGTHMGRIWAFIPFGSYIGP